MAELRLGGILPNGADNVVVEGKYVKGGYVAVATITERDALKGANGENIIAGSLCYVTGPTDNPINKFYQYNGTEWVEALTVTSITTTQINALWADISEEPEDTPAE